MKNKLKKILKIFLKVFIIVLTIYLIYAIGNIIYANSIIDEVVEAVNNKNYSELKDYDKDGLIYYCMYISKGYIDEKLNVFSYKKVETKYYPQKISWVYEIEMADFETIIETGKHTKSLLENIEENYVKERQMKKEVLKKTGEYNYLSEYYDSYKDFHIDSGLFLDLIKEAVLKDEKEYVSDDRDKFKVVIEYNIFTHEFDGLRDFYKIKNGEKIERNIVRNYSKIHDELTNNFYYNSMYKKGEKPITIITLNEIFVSLFEDNENPYLLNERERYIINNKMTLKEIEEYLLGEGYVYGRTITLENLNEDKIYLAFDGEKLLYIMDEENTEEIREKMQYYIDNNIMKNEILEDLENKGYCLEESLFYRNPQNLDEGKIIEKNDIEEITKYEKKGYLKIEDLYFYKPDYGYLIVEVSDNQFVYLYSGNTYMKKNEEFKNLTKEQIIQELEKEGFTLEK